MRIALVPTVSTPVRETGAASVESLVWLLSREMVALGHDVTVFACAGSEVSGRLVTTLPGPYAMPGVPEDWQLGEWINLVRAVEASGDFDIVHSHAYMWGVPLEGLCRAPMVHTLHVMPGPDMAILRQRYPGACVTSLSHAQWATFPAEAPEVVIPSAVDPAAFTFRAEPDDYVVFLGRFIKNKGPLRAIEAARRLGLTLRMAAPRTDYYDEVIKPHVDGRAIAYEGEVAGAERDRLLGGARAMLYPLMWPEPFGLVQLESMLCGTPVAAMAIGASPEVIDEGVTGFCAPRDEAFEEAVTRCLSLDRRKVYETAAAKSSPRQMALDYLRVYEKRLAE